MAPAFGATVANPMTEQERESLSHFVTPMDQKLSELFLWRVGNCFTHSDSVVRWLRANNWTSYSNLLMAAFAPRFMAMMAKSDRRRS